MQLLLQYYGHAFANLAILTGHAHRDCSSHLQSYNTLQLELTLELTLQLLMQMALKPALPGEYCCSCCPPKRKLLVLFLLKLSFESLLRMPAEVAVLGGNTETVFLAVAHGKDTGIAIALGMAIATGTCSGGLLEPFA